MSTSGTSARVIPGSGRGRRTTGRSPRPAWPRRARARHGVALELDLRHAALPAAAEAAARHTGLTVIVDHLGNPANPAAADPGEWREQVRRAAGESGVVMKISGPLTQQHGVPEGRRTAWHHGRTYGVRLTTIGAPASMHRLTIDKR